MPFPINTTGQQFHFDVDGTLGFIFNGSHIQTGTLNTAQLGILSDWNISTNIMVYPSNSSAYVTLVFPQTRNIVSISSRLAQVSSFNNSMVRVSYDTTNGQDGSWTQVVSHAEQTDTINCTQTFLRTGIKALPLTAVKGIEFYAAVTGASTSGISNVNLFGTYTPLGLQFWDPVLDIPMLGNHLNFDIVDKGSFYDKQFRIKNHSSQTANTVIITASTPEIGELYEGTSFSDGGSFGASVSITSIAPGAISPAITVRRTVSPGEADNTFGTARVTATATSWT